MFLFTDTDCRKQGADTDSCRTEVVDFVDLQTGINLAGAGENVVDLIGGDSIQAAAKGI